MADSPNPFNSRGQILGSKGEVYAAHLLRRKVSAFDLFKSFERKFGIMDESTYNSVVDMAKAGLTSGGLLNRSDRRGPIDLSQVPINEHLFGGDSGHGRAYIGLTLGMPGEPPARDVSIILPSSVDWESIYDVVSSQIEYNRSIGTDEWLLTHQLQTQELAIGVWFAERQF